uniref:Chromo domain-containing protein n=2 Tax=Homalodisca liturata TaxID=320908 RepID=A0A1B6J960_9HEMI
MEIGNLEDLGLNPGSLDLGEDLDSIGAQILSLAEAASSPPRLADSEKIVVESQSLLDSDQNDYLSLLQSIDCDLPVIDLSDDGLTPAPVKGVDRKSTGQRSYMLPGRALTVVNDVITIENSPIEIASHSETSPQGSYTSESKKKRSLNFKHKNVSSSFETDNLSTKTSVFREPRYKTRTLKEIKTSSDDRSNNHLTLCNNESVVSTGCKTNNSNNYKISNSDDSSAISCRRVKKLPRNVPPISIDKAWKVGEDFICDDRSEKINYIQTICGSKKSQLHPTSHSYSTLVVNKTDDEINVVDIDELLLDRSSVEEAEENIDVEGFGEDVLDIEATNKRNVKEVSKNITSKETIPHFKNLSKHEVKSLNNKRCAKKNINKNEIDPKNVEVDIKKKGLNAQRLSNMVNGVPNKKYIADKRILSSKNLQVLQSTSILKNCLINSKSLTCFETCEGAIHTSHMKHIPEGEKHNQWTLNKKQKEIISRASKINNLNPFNLLDHFSEEEIKILGGEIHEVSRENGFERGLEIESIEGATLVEDTTLLLIKWKGVNEAELIPSTVLRMKCPQLLIQFYQKRLNWICNNDCIYTNQPHQLHQHPPAP